VSGHGVEELGGTPDVDAVVELGLGDRFSDEGLAGEVYDRLDAGHGLIESGGVLEGALHELGSFVDRVEMPRREIVQNANAVPGLEEQSSGHAP
jgi:hypothetical protein